jgi:Protein of unknown function (DUF4012)
MEDKWNSHVSVPYKENEETANAKGMETLLTPARRPGNRRRRSRSRRTLLGIPFRIVLLLVCVGILLLSVGSLISVLEYQSYNALYHKDVSLAQGGEQQLKNAAASLQALTKNPVDTATVLLAQREFSSANTTFSQVNDDLKSIPAMGTLLPVYGSRLSTALRLAPLAVEMSQAGILSCNILQTMFGRYHNPLNTQSAGLSSADFNGIDKNFSQLKGLIEQAIAQVNQLQPSDSQFDPRIGKVIELFHQYLPTIETWLHNADALLAIAPTLLGVGVPSHYLIEVLDSTELRPGGGFIGNFGIATMTGGKLIDAHITDSYLFDGAFHSTGKDIPYPATYQWFSRYLAPASWSLRDSNLEADFPTSAQLGELNYKREGGNTSLQGLIAITPAFIQHLLAVTGPIALPEYHETVTAQNLVDLIHYHQLGPGQEGTDVPSPDGHSSVRKHFTELLAEHFMARTHQLPPSTMATFIRVMINDLHTKDLQVYFNAGTAETALQQLHLASTIDSTVNDGLFVVDANISQNKANNLITTTLNDQVTIDANGNALHQATLHYSWMAAGNVYGSLIYRDYVRVYMPIGSVVLQQQGWQPAGTSTAYGRKVIAGTILFKFHQTFTLHLVWKVPHAARKDVQGWHYLYEMQRQAGANWALNLTVDLPSCATIKNTSGGLTTGSKRAVALNKPINEDVLLLTDYSC